MVKEKDKQRLRRTKAMLLECGVTAAGIAKKINVSPATVYVVLGGFGTSKKIKEEVLRQLRQHKPGITYSRLWGPEK